MVGAMGCSCGAALKNSLSMPTIGSTRPSTRPRWKPLFASLDNAGRSSKPSRPPKESAGWTTTKSVTGKDGTGTLRWSCWPQRCWLSCAHGEKKTPGGQVPLSVPELRHLLTHLLWRGWHGVEHLLQWSQWRRHHQFHALRCHYRKRGAPLPIFYLQL